MTAGASQPRSPAQVALAGLTALQRAGIERRAQAVVSQAARGDESELGAAHQLAELMAEMYKLGYQDGGSQTLWQPGHSHRCGVP